MEITLKSSFSSKNKCAGLWISIALAVSGMSAYGQKFELTPLVGVRVGGNLKIQQDGEPNRLIGVDSSAGFGVAGGFRFDSDTCDACDLIEFRWMRQNTKLHFEDRPLVGALVRPALTLDHFLADFTHEFPTKQTNNKVSPFLTVSLGAVRLATPLASAVRFEFGLGGGVKVFLSQRWGIRFHGEYLPMVRSAQIQKVACGPSGCIAALNGGVMNQVSFSVGPIIRF
jgi:hypothetical protein